MSRKKFVLHPPTRSTAVAQPQMSRRTFFQGEECNDPRRVASKANGHGARDQVTVSKQPEAGRPDLGLKPADADPARACGTVAEELCHSTLSALAFPHVGNGPRLVSTRSP